jgi:hypothetical protein
MDNNCKGLTKDVCNKTKNCKYAEGEKRKFCRSHKQANIPPVNKPITEKTVIEEPVNKVTENNCKGLTKVICDKKEHCKYVDGDKRRYCRSLAAPRNQTKRVTIISKKNTKKSLNNSAKKTSNSLNSSAKNKFKKIFAKHTIRNYINKNKQRIKHNIRINYLKTVCSRTQLYKNNIV